MHIGGNHWSDLLIADHEMFDRVFEAVERALGTPESPSTQLVGDALEYFTSYIEGCHAHKEDDVLFPLMAGRGMPTEGGPLAVMIGEHRQSDVALADFRVAAERYRGGDQAALPALQDAFRRYRGVLREHFWKETDILFPMGRRLLSSSDDETVRTGIKAVEASVGPDTRVRFVKLAQGIVEQCAVKDLSENLTPSILAAMLNTLPIELSFVDANDKVLYFSHEHGQKIFPRGRGAIGRAVQKCHPDKSVDKVNAVLAAFKAGTRDVAEFWLDLRDRKVHVRYFAVRSPKGEYLGTLETVQDISDIQKIEGERRLLHEVFS
jgi:DUF438 domain-containing protein